MSDFDDELAAAAREAIEQPRAYRPAMARRRPVAAPPVPPGPLTPFFVGWHAGWGTAFPIFISVVLGILAAFWIMAAYVGHHLQRALER